MKEKGRARGILCGQYTKMKPNKSTLMKTTDMDILKGSA